MDAAPSSPSLSLLGMELRRSSPLPSHYWFAICLTLFILVPAASTQDALEFQQPLPTPVQCQTYAFAWTGGTPTYTLSISVSKPWSQSYKIYPLNGPDFPWVIPVPAGHTVNFELHDSASHTASAGPLIIQPNDDTSCFDSAETTSSNTPSTTTTTSSSITTSSATTSSTTIPSPTQAPTTTSSTSTTTPSTSGPPSTSTTSTSSAPSSPTPFSVSPPSTSQSLTTTDGPRPGSTPAVETVTVVPTTISLSSVSPTPHRATLSAGAIAGVAIGGAAVVVLAGALLVLWFCRRRKRQPSFGLGAATRTNAMGSEKATLADPDAISRARLRFGGPQSQMSTSSEAAMSASAHRLGPGPLPPSPLSSGSASDPFASSDGDGSRQLLLPPSSEEYDSMPKPSIRAAADTLASPSLWAPGVDPKPDAPPRGLPIPPSRSHPSPPHGPERTVQSYAAVPTDERPDVPARLMRFEEDGGVRLAGGMPGEVLDEDGESDPGEWVVQPPPYQRFR